MTIDAEKLAELVTKATVAEVERITREQARKTEQEFLRLLQLVDQRLTELENRGDAHAKHLANLDARLKAMK